MCANGVSCWSFGMGREEQSEGMAQLRSEYATLQQRHSAALELIGEKEETVEELRDDIAELKAAFQQQLAHFAQIKK